MSGTRKVEIRPGQFVQCAPEYVRQLEYRARQVKVEFQDALSAGYVVEIDTVERPGAAPEIVTSLQPMMKREGQPCPLCRRTIALGTGCAVTFAETDDGILERVKFGDEHYLRLDIGLCGECGAPLGEPHHPGCGVEECSICNTATNCPHMRHWIQTRMREPERWEDERTEPWQSADPDAWKGGS